MTSLHANTEQLLRIASEKDGLSEWQRDLLMRKLKDEIDELQYWACYALKVEDLESKDGIKKFSLNGSGAKEELDHLKNYCDLTAMRTALRLKGLADLDVYAWITCAMSTYSGHKFSADIAAHVKPIRDRLTAIHEAKKQ